MKFMIVSKLVWDSHFFNKEIGSVSLDQITEIKYCENFDLIFSFQKNDFIFEIDNFKNSFQQKKVIYLKEINSFNIIDSFEIKDFDSDYRNINFFKDLALESGKYSRFKLDENFENQHFEDLYLKWIENSLNKKFADKIFYLEENGVAIGFVTISKKENIATIGLISTHPDYQRKGLGKKLLQVAENYCFNSNLKFLEIPTQKENLQACQFYEKLGFNVSKELIIKHFWKN